MSAIDPDTIDTTQPPAIDPTTSGVRGVFLAVKALFSTTKTEIEALDVDVTTAQGDATQALADAATAQALGENHTHDGVGSQVVPHANIGGVGADDHHAEVHTHVRADVTDGVMFVSGDKMSEERLLAGYKMTVQAAADVAGGDYFDPREHSKADLTRTIQFRAVLSTSDAGKTAHAQLYSRTDATQICDLTTASVTPVELTQVLTIGAVGANQIPDLAKLYEVRVWEALGTGAESVILHKASFDVNHVAP